MRLGNEKKALGVALALAAVTLVAYWHLLTNGFISYDDTRYLFENEHVRPGLTLDGILWSLTSGYEGNWFPLTWISHMVDVSLFGFNPAGHHMMNLGLHLANAVLLLYLLYRQTGYLWRSAAVAALFALHPLHVESVAWAAERKDVLSTLFFMLSLVTYARYSERRTLPRYLAVFALFACGLASKPMLVTLPLVLLLFDLWPLGRIPAPSGERLPWLKREIWPLVREKLPLLGLSAASSFLTLQVQKGEAASLDPRHHSLFQNLEHALVNYDSYLGKTFWPVDLSVIYPYIEEVSLWEVAGAALVLGVLSWLAVSQWRRRSYLTVGWFWFLITLLPVVGLVKIGEHSIADRYSYIPLTGIFIPLVWFASELLEKWPRVRVAAAVASLALFALMAEDDWQETAYWKDSVTLFEHALKVTRDNYVAHSNLGSELMKYGKAEEAVPHFRESARLNPLNPEVHYNLGVALDTLGDESGAIRELKTVLEMNPRLVEAHFYLGTAYAKSGDLKDALDEDAILEQLSPEMARTLKSFIDSYAAASAGQHG